LAVNADDEGVTLSYYDFTSLYSYINLTARYPALHPRIIISEFEPIENYFGLAKITIEPPRGLFHPVLPYRSNGKLKFPLCRTCADLESQTPCKCSGKQRALTGVYCTPEILKAISLGYKLVKIHEVYHWDHSIQENPAQGQEGLFAPYVKTFLKLKQQASGYPSWCETPEQKEAYIEAYLTEQGIELDPRAIQYNEGLRYLCKLMLNSLWGM
jgi:hypothetical protein